MAKRENSDLAAIIRTRRYRVLSRRGWIQLGLRIMLLALILWLLLSQVFFLVQLEGNGMYPSLRDGDLLIGFRLQSHYQKDDVVVFTYQGKLCAGRIAARENDYVTLDDSGKVYVNGGIQTGEILYPTFPREGAETTVLVPPGSLYILGDYRTQTLDSRDFGPLPESAIEGKIVSILRRRGF